jgi:hypothetical protein
MQKAEFTWRSWRIVFGLAVLVFSLASPARAQYTSGIEGLATDQTGALIPGAHVILTNEETQVTQAVEANSQGFLQILHLPPGRYRISVAAAGFVTWEQKDLDIEGTDIRTVYPKLTVGSQTATIQVTANTATVETTSGTISRTLESQTIQNAPLVGEVLYASVATLAPGVTGLGGMSGSGQALGTNSFNTEPAFQVIGAGQRQETTYYEVDGTDMYNSTRDGVVAITPEPDSVAQMKISSNVFAADKGRQSGALVEVFTKSGTNNFHGTLSEFYTGSALTARTEFETRVPRYIRNDFGGTIGGPIIKSKTFFFGSLFWSRSQQGVTLTQPMETRQFVDYVAANYPNSLAAGFFKNAPSGGVPTSGFQTVSQIEKELISPYPVPNIPGDLAAIGNVSISQSPIDNGFQGHVRIDHNYHDGNDKIFYSLFHDTTQQQSPNPRPALALVEPNVNWYDTVDYVHMFSPRLVNDASVNYGRVWGIEPGPPGSVLNTLPNAFPTGLGGTFDAWGNSGWTHNNWNWHDVLSYVQGRHSLRTGIDVARQQAFANFTANLSRPTFVFANIVDFAVDHPSSQRGPIVDVAAESTARHLYSRSMSLQTAPFIQDDWKLSKRLTLNLGVRFDYFGHLGTGQYGPSPVFFFGAGSGATKKNQIANGFMSIRGANGAATTQAMWRFAPRIGFAYDVFGDGSTSIHGGWGIFDNYLGNGSWGALTNAPQFANPTINIFNAGTTLSSFSYAASPTGPGGFPIPPGLAYQVDSHGGLVGTRVAVNGVQPDLRPPMVQDWAVSVQRSIGKSVMIEADYFGSASRDLYFHTDVNRFAGDLIQNKGILNRLNQSFASTIYGQSIGIANANVGSFSITKRFSRGWSVHAIYDYGKSLDYTSSNDNGVSGAENVFDPFNPSRNYGRSDYDARHRISVDAVWDIRGLKGGIGHLITDGWMLSPVIVLQSGQPFTVYTSATYPSGDFNADGFDYDVPDVPAFGNTKSTSRSDFLKGVFSVSAFPLPQLGTEGNLGRNTYNGPGYANTDLAASRTFKLPFLGEQGEFQVRGEILNLFNRVNLTNVVSDMANGEFGHATGQNQTREVQAIGRIVF